MTSRRHGEVTAFTRYGGWIPSDERVYHHFHHRLALSAGDGKLASARHNPAVQAFADAINKVGPGEKKSLMRTLFDKIFLQAAKKTNLIEASSFLQPRRLQR